ncbi:Vesicle transport protein [Boothiomyces macroporosus]|uniref:Protein transport protein SFT2 n=1 Tax=Boothiomyces macroporosus TaxID=261099 RepID=A0AAD5UJD9_9FUNG|nr:Vesicle transport protein [Boothiomyces macroporosus]
MADNFRDSFAQFNKSQQQKGFKLPSLFQQNDAESSESLLDSFQSRASSALSSMGLNNSNPDKECFGLSTFQRYVGFMILLGTSGLFLFISLFSLPLLLVAPAKFALTYTMGSLMFLLSFSILNGWRAHLKHLFCWERAPFTTSYLVSMMGTLYFSMIHPSYIPVIFFTVLQVIALLWYLASYLPGGTSGMKWITSRTLSLPV